jgi:hypothetical protein
MRIRIWRRRLFAHINSKKISPRHENKKFPSRSPRRRTNLRITFALTGLCLTAGCLSTRKNAKPKETTAIAAELEESFRQRWVEKRASELIARGLAADLARTQAFEEFKTKYNFPSSPAR